jgi:hypothetical protein
MESQVVRMIEAMRLTNSIEACGQEIERNLETDIVVRIVQMSALLQITTAVGRIHADRNHETDTKTVTSALVRITSMSTKGRDLGLEIEKTESIVRMSARHRAIGMETTDEIPAIQVHGI